MEYRLDQSGAGRLKEYLEEAGDVLGDKRRRASFATYAIGLLSEGERKSAEPMAARACPDPKEVDKAHQRLTYITRSAEWSDRDIRRLASRYGIAAMTAHEPISAWIIDDTGFLKQGKHSVGVQRQYSGSAGKVANCQIGVSLTVATDSAHLPIDFSLYLPESWASDPALRTKARIADDVTFKTKPELALDMIERAVDDGVCPGLVLADSAYGDNSEFRRRLRCLGLDYAVGIHRTTTVWRLDRLGRRIGDPIAVGDLAMARGRRRFRRSTWRQGTKTTLSSRFAAERVVLAHDDMVEPSQREAVWLLMEWPDEEEGATDFTVATLPETLSRRELVARVKERWRTERVYEDAKGELGLDHYEGRTYPGWNHHVSIVLFCFAFIVAERCRAFPPSGAKLQSSTDPRSRVGTNRRAPSSPLRRFLHYRPARRGSHPRLVAPSLSHVSPLRRPQRSIRTRATST
jgi:SRSO17 transposase